MAAKDETIRRLAATIASNSYRAHPERVAARRATAELPSALRQWYEEEVDPSGTLAPDVRHERAAAAWRRDRAQHQLDEHRAGRGDGDGGAAA